MLDETPNVPATLRSLREIVEEYEAKREGINDALATFQQAATDLETAACIGGTWGGAIWGRGGNPKPWDSQMRDTLLASAWKHVMAGLQIREIATAKDLARLETSMENPPEFTLDNIRATFGKYLIDPRSHMLRGVAEAFCDLDPAYKSHSKGKVGVAGLPKRIILTNALCDWGWRGDQLRDVLNAMAALHETPRMEFAELDALKRAAKRGDDPEFLGVTVRGFQNGNAHLIFDPQALRCINLAIAEFYGEVLPDAEPENATRAPSTAVSKDLAYYPTPEAVIAEVMAGEHVREGEMILEPSCGDGRILDWLRKHHPRTSVTGIEYHQGRADEAKAKGHHVQVANFLRVAPQPIFDRVVMNPPFSGRHYLKHIAHALRFLKPGGRLVAILPASAHYDHGELPSGIWRDLPVGSFSESGTNVPTGYFRTNAPEGK